jgi:hypothetical protein
MRSRRILAKMSDPTRRRIVKVGEDAYDVYIGRGKDSVWGNPFIIGVHGNRSEVIAQYKEWVVKQPDLMARLPELKGKILGCFCASKDNPKPCHGTVLLLLLKSEGIE